MCLTIPVQIKKIKGLEAELADGRKINIALIPKPKRGDWILANANLGLSKISAKEAKEIKGYFKL
jgi:hydrogenase assembly chaperone HypC/HupF